MLRIGIDFGGVIAGKLVAGQPMIPSADAFEVLHGWRADLSADIWIISKASAATERDTRSWLEAHAFFDATSVPRSNLVFVRERTGKREECARLHLDLFIDDLPKNLESLRGVVPNLIRFGESSDVFDSVPDWRSADLLVRTIAG